MPCSQTFSIGSNQEPNLQTKRIFLKQIVKERRREWFISGWDSNSGLSEPKSSNDLQKLKSGLTCWKSSSAIRRKKLFLWSFHLRMYSSSGTDDDVIVGLREVDSNYFVLFLFLFDFSRWLQRQVQQLADSGKQRGHLLASPSETRMSCRREEFYVRCVFFRTECQKSERRGFLTEKNWHRARSSKSKTRPRREWKFLASVQDILAAFVASQEGCVPPPPLISRIWHDADLIVVGS